MSRTRNVRNPQKKMFTAARARAKKKGLLFDIDQRDVIVPEHCPVFGYSLEVRKGVSSTNSPTLDRIDNSRGYVKGNVWVISKRANTLKNDGSLEDLKTLVTALEARLK